MFANYRWWCDFPSYRHLEKEVGKCGFPRIHCNAKLGSIPKKSLKSHNSWEAFRWIFGRIIAIRLREVGLCVFRLSVACLDSFGKAPFRIWKALCSVLDREDSREKRSSSRSFYSRWWRLYSLQGQARDSEGLLLCNLLIHIPKKRFTFIWVREMPLNLKPYAMR